MNFIKKYWRDPVGSKLIASGIGFLILWVIDYFTLELYIETWNNFVKIITYETPIYLTISLITISIIATRIYIMKCLDKVVNELGSKFDSLNDFNKKTDYEKGILYRWEPIFDENTAFINNLELFCNKHDYPILFINNQCPERACENHNIRIDKKYMFNKIESELIFKWHSINDKRAD